MTQETTVSHSPAEDVTTVSVVIIGDEVLAGDVADLNGPLILSLLAERGLHVLGLHVLPDDPAIVAPQLRRAAREAEAVLVTGGIGPTHDDITRLAVAQALGRPLVVHPEAIQRLESIFRRGATAAERDMALLPEGAELLFAPGVMAFAFQVGNVLVFPGVPRLLEPLLRANVERLGQRATHRRELRTDLREGLIAAPFSDLARRWPDVRWGSYPELTDQGWSLRLVIRGRDPGRLDAAFGLLEAMIAELETRS